MRFSVAAFMMIRPVSVEPVKAILAIRELLASGPPDLGPHAVDDC